MTEADEVAESIARKLLERGETVAVAESAAGGLIAAALLGVAGASGYYKGGVVVYNADGKQRLAGMSQAALDANRPSTEPHTADLARALRDRLDATWVVAETGAAGPTGNRYGDAAGHAALAVVGPVEVTHTIETRHGDRRQNMVEFALAALRLLDGTLSKR